MFSWKNIKDTFNEKVKNSDSAGDKALGILEVVGKSLVSGTTAVVKEIPNLVTQAVDEKSKETKKRSEQILNDPNSSDESKEKARDYLDNKHDDIRQKVKEQKEKNEQSSLRNLDFINIEQREKSSYERKITNAERCINKYIEQSQKLEQKKENLELKLVNLVGDELIKCQEDIAKISTALTDYDYKINKNHKDIEKYKTKLELYD
jgi:chromosome segregation ATPase